MEPGEYVVVIRDYRPGDDLQCKKVIFEAAMSTVGVSFRRTLTREVALHLVVVISAIMFVFLGFSPLVCLMSLPLTAATIFLTSYVVHLIEAFTRKDMFDIPRTYMSSEYTGFWVAEVFMPEPHSAPYRFPIRILRGPDGTSFLQQHSDLNRRVIGTAAMVGSTTDASAAWMRRMAVSPAWQKRGIASALLTEVLEFCRKKGYSSVELVTSEFHEEARTLYTNKGFELRQLYHKPVIANLVRTLMYDFTYSLKK